MHGLKALLTSISIFEIYPSALLQRKELFFISDLDSRQEKRLVVASFFKMQPLALKTSFKGGWIIVAQDQVCSHSVSIIRKRVPGVPCWKCTRMGGIFAKASLHGSGKNKFTTVVTSAHKPWILALYWAPCTSHEYNTGPDAQCEGRRTTLVYFEMWRKKSTTANQEHWQH